MDIFNRKRVEELETQLEEMEALRRENERLRNCLDRATSDLNHILNVKQAIPEDCVPGTWCKACEFGKATSYYHTAYDAICSGYLCSKGESCKHFIQKKAEEK